MHGKNLDFVFFLTIDSILSKNVCIHYLVACDIFEPTTPYGRTSTRRSPSYGKNESLVNHKIRVDE
jgi:hypothetical protein